MLMSIILNVSIASAAADFVSGLLERRKNKDTNEDEEAVVPTKRTVKVKVVSKPKPDGENLDFEIDAPKKKKERKTTIASEEKDSSEIESIIFTPDPEDAIQTEDKNNKKDKKAADEERAKPITTAERDKIHSEIDGSITQGVKEYKIPPISLLKATPPMSADKRQEMRETAQKLMEVLSDFNVEAKLLQVTQGPSVTRYEIQPETGIKLSKITGLSEDIAWKLAVPTVLVAAVPGKAAVGIEVPNTSVATVSARELIESPKFKTAASKLTCVFGKDIGGNVVVGNIESMPHVLIAGSTGSGKSVCINTIITSILYKASPDEVKLIMVDPKVVELGVYNGIPHLLIPVVTDPKRAAGALNWAVQEMMRRYALFAQNHVRNISGYNEHQNKTGEEKLPQIVIIIDELADLMMVAAKEVEDSICRLAQLARAAGIHLIVATQRPSVDVITGLIKANVPSRIAFAVSSQVDSRTILDRGGAEKLLGRGDMLYYPAGFKSPLRVQGAYVSDSEIEAIVNFIKENSEVTHYSEDLADHIERCSNGENAVTNDGEDENDGDPLLPQAI
ncbi:MAG: DNA translocase FtsK, partial [Clostridia bacterium]|nr:DNA translocase FtsK [Clostridia bacterium]